MAPRKWQKHLTDRERAQIASLDKRIAAMDEKLSLLRVKRRQIQNRATARVKQRRDGPRDS